MTWTLKTNTASRLEAASRLVAPSRLAVTRIALSHEQRKMCSKMTPAISDSSEQKRAAVRISKSKFVAGVQCLKRLYLQVHEPELASEPDAAVEAIMEQGQEVGLLAHQLFPGGVTVSGNDGLDEAKPHGSK